MDDALIAIGLIALAVVVLSLGNLSDRVSKLELTELYKQRREVLDGTPEPECVVCGQPAHTLAVVPKEWSGKVCQACWDRRHTYAKVDENGAYSQVVSISSRDR